MIIVNDLNPGTTFQHEGDIFTTLDVDRNKTAMRQMVIKVKVKNLRSGVIKDLVFTGGDKVEPAHIDKKEMQYLYDDGTMCYFMDNETYEQISVSKALLEWEVNFLVAGVEVEVMTYNGEILGLTLPVKVTLQITESEPAVRGDTTKTPMKDAILETGLKVKVPIFVEQGESIVVSTEDGTYVSRA